MSGQLGALLLFPALLISVTQAGPLDLLNKAGRLAKKAGPGGAALSAARLSRSQAIGLASSLGAGVIYVDARSGRLMAEALETGVTLLEGTIDDIGRLTDHARTSLVSYTPRYLLDRESALELHHRLDILLAKGTVYVAEPSMNGVLTVVRRAIAGRVSYYKELRRNILVSLKTEISPEAVQALFEPMQREQIRVVSMFSSDDIDAVQKLAVAAGDALVEKRVLTEALEANSLHRLRGRTVIVVGHIEDGAFVERGVAGTSASPVSIQALEKLAEAADVKLLSAGCSSFCAGASRGFDDVVTDTEMANAVRTAFKSNTNVELLQAFGQERPLILSQEALDDFATSRSLRLAEIQKGESVVSAGAMSVRLFRGLTKPSFIQEMLEMVGGLYILGVLSGLIMFRSNRAAFLRVFPRLPSPILGETRNRYYAAWIGRELLFVALAPMVVGLTVLTFFFGGWSYREDIVGSLWTCVKNPITGVSKFLLVICVGLIYLFVYSFGLLVLSLPAIILLVLTVSVSDQVWFWPTLLSCLGYCVVAYWASRKAHRSLQRWLSSGPSITTPTS